MIIQVVACIVEVDTGQRTEQEGRARTNDAEDEFGDGGRWSLDQSIQQTAVWHKGLGRFRAVKVKSSHFSTVFLLLPRTLAHLNTLVSTHETLQICASMQCGLRTFDPWRSSDAEEN